MKSNKKIIFFIFILVIFSLVFFNTKFYKKFYIKTKLRNIKNKTQEQIYFSHIKKYSKVIKSISFFDAKNKIIDRQQNEWWHMLKKIKIEFYDGEVVIYKIIYGRNIFTLITNE